MKNNYFLKFDYLLILVVSILITAGIMFIYSSGINPEGRLIETEYKKQILWAAIGFIFMIFLTLYDYRKIEKKSPYLFAALIIILIYTLLFGKYVNGAKSWIGIGTFGIQPSEFGKIIYILFYSYYLCHSENTKPLKRFIIALAILSIPVSLILLQPDLGSAVVYIPIFLIMSFIADIPLKYLLYIVSLGALSIIFTILPIWNSEISTKQYPAILILDNKNLRLFLIIVITLLSAIGLIIHKYFHSPKYIKTISLIMTILALSLCASYALGKILKDYQIKRLIIFMNPEVDPQGAGWNIIQSKIAIGSGGLVGQGYLQGTQSHYRFLPEQSTDFIFSILSEETGFIGSIIIFALYLIMLIRILLITKSTTNKYGTNISAGIFALFAYHFLINVGMVIGIMPITGIPLLFLSYGGSSLITATSAIGLVMGINSKKLKFR